MYVNEFIYLVKEKNPAKIEEYPNSSQFDPDHDVKMRNNTTPFFFSFELTRKYYDDFLLLLAHICTLIIVCVA